MGKQIMQYITRTTYYTFIFNMACAGVGEGDHRPFLSKPATEKPYLIII